MKGIVIIKAGSQVVTDPQSGRVRKEWCQTYFSEIQSLQKEGYGVIAVSSGAVAQGKGVSKSHPQTIADHQVLAAIGQPELIYTYQQIAKGMGITLGQILVSKHDFRSAWHAKNIQRCLIRMLELKYLPLVNENDAVSVRELMFTDNDEIASLMAGLMGAKKLIIMTQTDGVYTRDPKEGGVHVPAIQSREDLKSLTYGAISEQGRGGIQSKVQSCLRAAELGIETHIVNGAQPSIITSVMNGTAKQTYFPPQKKLTSKQRFLGSQIAKEAGEVRLNAQATNIFLEDPSVRRSVLPIGIEAVYGDFYEGEVIRVSGANNELIGLGLAEYDSTKARLNQGHHQKSPLVIPDNFYLFS